MNVLDFCGELRKAMVKGEKPSINITDQDEFIKAIDRLENRPEKALISAMYLLSTAYKNRVSANRAKNLKSALKTNGDVGQVKMPHKSVQPKIIRSECITDQFIKCTSVPVKVAIALFLTSNFADAIKRDFIYSIINNTTPNESASFILELDTIAKLRQYIATHDNKKKMDTKWLLLALVELSELLKDKSCSKLAMDINPEKYLNLIKKHLERPEILLNSIIPFEPIINKFVRESIALCSQESERSKIINQFKTNAVETITSVINGLPPPKSNKISRVSSKACVFKPNETYYYYKGLPGYTRNIVSTYHRVGNTTFRVLTYNDCLYDVIGKTTETVDENGHKVKTEEMFNTKTWPERLLLLEDFRTKIVVNSVQGSELNNYVGAPSDITVSWFENECSCSKTYLMKKIKDSKIKVETDSDV